MRKYLLLLLFPLAANANCFYDYMGTLVCQPLPTYQTDFRDSTNSPKIYENGQYRGNYNFNQYDPNSVNNQWGKYGNPYSPDSPKNPYRLR